jgi:hypothetical protein
LRLQLHHSLNAVDLAGLAPSTDLCVAQFAPRCKRALHHVPDRVGWMTGAAAEGYGVVQQSGP